MPRARTLLALLLAVPACAGGTPAAVAQQDTQAAPAVASAVGISRTRVRLRFAEPVTSSGVAAADVTLSMGGTARPVTRVEVAPDGTTAEVEAGPAWGYGTAGSVRLKGGDPVRVWASPGDTIPPVLKGVRLLRSTVCVVASSRNCAASGGTVAFTVDESVTVVLDLRRRSTDAPSLLKVVRGAGAGRVRFKEKIEGRRLRPGLFRLTVTAVDAAGNESRPVTLRLRVRR